MHFIVLKTFHFTLLTPPTPHLPRLVQPCHSGSIIGATPLMRSGFSVAEEGLKGREKEMIAIPIPNR